MDTSAADMINGLRRQRLALLDAIEEANLDIGERAASEGAIVWYDHDDDSLVIAFGETIQEAATESVGHMLLLRVDPETLKLVGLEITGFRAVMDNPPPGFEALVQFITPLLHAEASHQVLSPLVAQQIAEIVAGRVPV